MSAPIPLQAFTDNYIWIVADKANASFFCVDPGESAPVLEYARKTSQTLAAILLTHHHSDHIGGVEALCADFPDARVYAPMDARIGEQVQRVKEGDTIELRDFRFQVLETPGHTATHISLLEPDKGWLFCGDTLFSAGCGRVFDGTVQALYRSLSRMKALPGTTLLYPAHEYTRQNIQFARTMEPNNEALIQYEKQLSRMPQSCSLPSTVARECAINPFLRTECPEIVASARKAGVSQTSPEAIFAWLRSEKNNFKPI
ncbi:hydroxyacylglutathione hydrolase (glyoxalase II) [Legionella geestiana]|uniref:Hydroxyacylglutathione hydrolase n=2 Tax=Legionella geestiana TaxID=45065 RepID=A0A0W0TYY5_9GAMM|nr:hydroxyacylglutathione hydrolase [Legionella geestiana]KTD00737.1 hydroxyacylglutathione hydrolase (glyoxalase II) [Legionella geestiana]QBS13375.1 hydroxyacylglutathione hydrolase [Legionella geestiana]QDQ41145.1 hydroxyacylglutathione hydrolase [Legionella geestiana]STX53728.1 hydroxyacylglutathione hydrolase [Legionella geestiana]